MIQYCVKSWAENCARKTGEIAIGERIGAESHLEKSDFRQRDVEAKSGTNVESKFVAYNGIAWGRYSLERVKEKWKQRNECWIVANMLMQFEVGFAVCGYEDISGQLAQGAGPSLTGIVSVCN